MQHIRSSIKGVFLLQHEGVPLEYITDFGEDVIEGSLCINTLAGDIYILKNSAWIKVGSDVAVSIDYVRPTPTKVSVGGLASGTVPNFSTIQGVLDAMLYPFTPPTSSLSSSSIHEKGLDVNKTMNYNITPNNAIVTSREIRLNNVFESTINNNSGSYTGLTTLNYQNSTPSLYYTQSYSLVTQYSNYTTTTNSINVSFVAPQYYGVLTSSNINETNIKGLTKLINTKQNLSTSLSPNNQRYIYAYPAIFGDLTQIVDQNNFNITAGFSKTLMSFTLADSSTENYNVYSSNSDTTQTGFGITFKF